MAEKANEIVYQLKVTLRESNPPIWRRFQVPGNVTLHRLHLVLQSVMGWTNSHLYAFDISGVEYSVPDPEEGDFYGVHFADSRKTRLSKVVSGEKAKIRYDYDFGDGWEHDIVVEKRLPDGPDVRYPICLAGKRACPPEDCGGVWGYARLLEIIRDPTHEEYEDMMDWLGGIIDPEEFNLDAVNRSLARFRRAVKSRQSDIPQVFRRAFESETT